MTPIAATADLGLSANVQMGQLKNLQKSEQLGYVGQQFESIFVRQFLSEGLKPMFKGALGEDGAASDIYRFYMVDTLARDISQTGAFGVANMVQLQLQGQHTEPVQ